LTILTFKFLLQFAHFQNNKCRIFFRRNVSAVFPFFGHKRTEKQSQYKYKEICRLKKKLNPLKAREEESQIKATLQIRLYVLVAPLVFILRKSKQIYQIIK